MRRPADLSARLRGTAAVLGRQRAGRLSPFPEARRLPFGDYPARGSVSPSTSECYFAAPISGVDKLIHLR